MTMIRFSAEVGAESPLRDEHDAMIDLDALPLSDGLRAELGEWADAASHAVNVETNPDVPSLRRAGEELCTRTAAELGRGYEVHFDWLVPSKATADGVAMLMLVTIFAACFFGILLLLPYDTSAGTAVLVALFDVPLLVFVYMVVARRRRSRVLPLRG